MENQRLEVNDKSATQVITTNDFEIAQRFKEEFDE